MSRTAQVKAAFDMTRKADPKLVPIMAGGFILAFLAFFMFGWGLIGNLIVGIVLGLLAGALAATILFGQRAQRMQYGMLEGQPGAAVAVIQSMKGYLATPAIAYNKKQDMVHLVVGRCGVLLIGEAQSQSINTLLKQEKQKLKRMVGDTEVKTMVVGAHEGQVPVDKVRFEVQKLGRVMKPEEYRDLHQKLDAIVAKRQPKMPGGPMHAKRPKVR